MVLTRGDDFPIHQTPEPIAYSGTDRNFYDRYFFNGYNPDGSGFFALAFGIYPHLNVADAHFCVTRGDVQHALHASRDLGMERMDLAVGPIRIEIVEPLHALRLIVDGEGMAADILFTSRAFAIEEPRFTHRIGTRTFMDYTRMTQNGTYAGWIEVGGVRCDIAPGAMGTRDRSWGIRPIGARDEQPIPGVIAPSFFWQWTPINLPSGCLFFHNNAEPNGASWNTRAAWVPTGGEAGDIREGHAAMDARLQPGTRWPQSGTLSLEVGGAPASVELTVKSRFQMRGLGYTSPHWGHGLYHGPLEIAREDIALNEIAPLTPHNLHVQMVCDARANTGEAGIGIFEQLIIGPYAPLGLREFLSGAD